MNISNLTWKHEYTVAENFLKKNNELKLILLYNKIYCKATIFKTAWLQIQIHVNVYWSLKYK